MQGLYTFQGNSASIAYRAGTEDVEQEEGRGGRSA